MPHRLERFRFLRFFCRFRRRDYWRFGIHRSATTSHGATDRLKINTKKKNQSDEFVQVQRGWKRSAVKWEKTTTPEFAFQWLRLLAPRWAIGHAHCAMYICRIERDIFNMTLLIASPTNAIRVQSFWGVIYDFARIEKYKYFIKQLEGKGEHFFNRLSLVPEWTHLQ